MGQLKSVVINFRIQLSLWFIFKWKKR